MPEPSTTGTYAEPCGPDCVYCESVGQAMQVVCGLKGHNWVEAGGGLSYCEECAAERREPDA